MTSHWSIHNASKTWRTIPRFEHDEKLAEFEASMGGWAFELWRAQFEAPIKNAGSLQFEMGRLMVKYYLHSTVHIRLPLVFNQYFGGLLAQESAAMHTSPIHSRHQIHQHR